MWAAVFLFLLVAGATGAALIGASILYFRGQGSLARFTLAAAAGVLTAYGSVWLTVASLGSNAEIAVGQEKHICEIDCHIAYSVVRAKVRKSGGTSEIVVTVRTRFDPTTTGLHRGDSPLTPGPRVIRLIVDGQEIAPASDPDQLTRSLRPGESFETDLVFDTPAPEKRPRLFIADALTLNGFLVGSENTDLDRRILLRVPYPPAAPST